ncbi:hypothetical protein Misp01_28460 [Microtetraspora sp. NBRC 13810]|uniref:neutral zinc metallopeptidase n=1 Tax=Microtetraspora sp. NBRC 13810 TaxID=3030990 RepID=UPI0024A5548A|nr:neutral zinc metallopeptidase [Microtetraspora sp. NBRC 13810]GLW07716.1 hypothetical protein Misp01_28460 [Microtetraspora sp. NBRC 13810]
MRRLWSLLAVVTVFSLLCTGTAEAPASTAPPAPPAAQREAGQDAGTETGTGVDTAPEQGRRPARGKASATANALYRTGRLPRLRCAPGEILPGSAASYRGFMSRVTACLNRSWGRQFAKARLPFTKPRLRFVTGQVSSPCGKWPTGAGGYYCSANRTIYIGITKRVLREGFELGSAQFMAHEYAHHVQTLSGIGPDYYFPRHAWAGRAEALALSRRFEVQADCMGSAFLGSVAGTLPVRDTDWRGMIEWTTRYGDEAWPANDHGKGSTQAYWMGRGFEACAPGACNTWTASKARVA